MSFEDFIELLERVEEDPNSIPDNEEDIEGMVMDAARDWEPDDLTMKCTLLSLMLHNAALQGCVDLLTRDYDAPERIFPSIH